MSTAIVQQSQQPLSIADTRLSVAQMKAQRDAIVELMSKSMKPNIDYGIVPGCDKPSLWKPGSEKILAMLHLAATPTVEDLSTPDAIRYRLHVAVTHFPTGAVLGTGIGEASSAESKYQWRGVVCQEEWDATPEDRRRTKWKKSRNGAYSVQQVRADMDDVANTVLKMAKKRAQVDAVLTTTAASDIFSQDLEDLRDAGLDADPENGEGTSQPTELPRKQPESQPAPSATPVQQPAAPAQPAQSHGAKTITEQQGKLFWAKAMNRCNDYKLIMDYLKNVHGVRRKEDILMARFDEAVLWAETGRA